MGGEVAIGSFLVSYMNVMVGFTPGVAGTYLMFYWGGAMVGRFIGSFVLRFFKPGVVLGCNATIVCLLLVVTMMTKGQVAMWTVLSIGLFNSIMFPTIFTLAIAKLGRHTSSGSALLCMAIVGGALLPWVTGKLADIINLQYSFVVPLVCYLYIVFYGFKCSVPKLPESVTENDAMHDA